MNEQPSPAPPWQPRFGLGSMMLVILVCAVTAAAGRYLIQAMQTGTSSRAIFVMFVLVAPMFLLVTLSAFRLITGWLQRFRRR